MTPSLICQPSLFQASWNEVFYSFYAPYLCLLDAHFAFQSNSAAQRELCKVVGLFLGWGWSWFKRWKPWIIKIQMVQKKKKNRTEQQWRRGRLVLLGSADLTDCSALFLDGRCSRGKCMCVYVCAGWACVFMGTFHKVSRGPSGQSRSARVSSSSFSSLPGDAAELKECVSTAQFVI